MVSLKPLGQTLPPLTRSPFPFRDGEVMVAPSEQIITVILSDKASSPKRSQCEMKRGEDGAAVESCPRSKRKATFGHRKSKSALFFVHQKECFSVRDFPPEKRRLRSDSVVLLPHTKASALLIPQMPDACEGLYFSVKISPPSSSFFMERPTECIYLI